MTPASPPFDPSGASRAPSSLQPLVQALREREDDLLSRLVSLSRQAEYTRYTSTREEDWRVTVREPADQLAAWIEARSEPEAMHVDEVFQENPRAAFGIQEARLHRERGITLEMFLGLCKLMRQTFVELARDSLMEASAQQLGADIIHRYFDKFELGFVSEWVRLHESERSAELQARNRLLTNDKNRYHTLFVSLSEPAFVLDDRLHVQEVNPAFESLVSAPSSSLVGRPCWEVLGQVNAERCTFSEQRTSPAAFADKELTIATRRGPRTMILGGAPLVDISGKNAGVLGVLTDITDRVRVEGALREALTELHVQKEFAEELIELAPAVVLLLGPDGRIQSYNRFLEQISGRPLEETRGADWFETFLPEGVRVETQEVLAGTVAGQPVIRNVNPIVTRTGEQRQIAWYARPLLAEDGSTRAVLSIGLDITEQLAAEDQRQELEQRIQQDQKLESLGLLAGGIAHDFNNMLMGILGNASMALEDLSPVSPVREFLVDIELAARRASDLSRQMLAYSGKGRFRVEHLDLRELVEEMGQLLEASINKRAVLKYDFGQPLPRIEADATQIRQVIMNLITNASDAIGARSGIIAVTVGVADCRREYLDQTFLADHLPEGQYVFFEVSDTGVGMDEATRERIFDPFFTTKVEGRGLGLSAVLGIIRGHRGAIRVYSEPGRGTTFKVLLPAVEHVDVPRPRSDAPIARRRRGLVLFADDDETSRAVGRRMLEREGFEVLTANDGQQAVDLFRGVKDDLVLVMLDLTMPHLDGEQVFRILRQMASETRVIIVSGYNRQEVVTRFAGKGLAGFIQKPFEPELLRLELERVLGDEHSDER
jgi:PAS domain S-box-containing protein